MSDNRVYVKCSFCGTGYTVFACRVRARNFCSPEHYYAMRQDTGYVPWRQGQRRARAIVGRYFDLLPQHVVHHEDSDNRNNELSNLRVFASQADHMAYHHGTLTQPIWDGTQANQTPVNAITEHDAK